jgi:F-type H+-transporting ATPase subunit delta
LRSETIARNYAVTLFVLAEKDKATQQYADLLDAVAHGIAAAPQVEAVLMSPRVTKAKKADLLARAVAGAPRDFIRFLGAVVKRGRQGLFGAMAVEFQGLLDQKLQRVRAAVTVARPVDEKFQKQVTERLTAIVGKEVLPHFHEDPSLLGGLIVRVGDRVFDGSVRRRMTVLRRLLLTR